MFFRKMLDSKKDYDNKTIDRLKESYKMGYAAISSSVLRQRLKELQGSEKYTPNGIDPVNLSVSSSVMHHISGAILLECLSAAKEKKSWSRLLRIVGPPFRDH